MQTVWTIARRELRSLFDHPTGYILLVVFVVVTDFLFFRQAYLTNVASLRPMLQLLPWIFLFFVPGAASVPTASRCQEVPSQSIVVAVSTLHSSTLAAGRYK